MNHQIYIFSCVLLAGCGSVKDISNQSSVELQKSERKAAPYTIKSVIIQTKETDLDRANCATRVPRVGSDLAAAEATIRKDLKLINKSDAEIEAYIAKWRCETNYLRN